MRILIYSYNYHPELALTQGLEAVVEAALSWQHIPNITIVLRSVFKMAKINGEQFLYTELSETLRFSEPELDIKPYSKEESKIQASSENEKSISKVRSRTQVTGGAAVSQQRKSGFRRWSGLSEY